MSQYFIKMIQAGATAEIADAVKDDPSLARSRDPQGVSALLWSVYTGQTTTRDFLLTQLAAQSAALSVFEAAAIGDVRSLNAILAADPDAAYAFSGDGWTALHLAAAFGSPETVALLIERGAVVGTISQNPQRNQPLHAALALGRNLESVRLLLAHGADPNAVQAGGFTPLFSAATAHRRDLAELLIAQGAQAHHHSDLDKTAADFARERGHADLAAWLESQPV
jgi:ankyrin repeat protein